MDNFIYNSRKINFIDAKGDPFIEASKLRKITALNFHSLLELGEDNKTVCALLEKNLNDYSSVVDDPKGVNNYADRVLELLPNNHIGHQSKWKTSLNSDKVAEFLKPLSCSSNKTDKWARVSCSNAHPTTAELKHLKDAFDGYQNNILPQPKVTQTRELPRKEPIRSFSQPKTSTSTRGFQPKISLFKKPPQPSTSGQNINSGPPKKQNAFKTASDELKQQNLQKYGKTEGRGEGQHSYGGGKKSLGARVGSNVYSKFQPPVIRSESDMNCDTNRNNNPETEDEEVDERLKNIDPKMIELIRNEIMDTGPKLTWDDIAGLEFAKNTIQEVVVWPMLRPDIFTGLRRPPKGILLFGPPGTGKTLIGKCIASQSGATFLSISSSSLTSKWVGDGEKMVRALFAVARVYQPAVVFIDEIDSLLSQRSDTEHESSRRIKTEFLVQLDGCTTGEEDRVLIIGATNRPQELDEAARRRLVKRLYIPLPELNARAEIVRNLISKERHTLSNANIEEVAELTDGYSGADVKHVCQEASLGPIRSIPAAQIRNIDTSQVRPVNVADFKSALVRVKSTVSQNDLDSYITWDKQFGCGSL